MALLGAAVVTINLFAGCGSTGAEQTGNNADGTATEAVQGKDSAGGGMRRRAWQEAQIRSSWR